MTGRRVPQPLTALLWTMLLPERRALLQPGLTVPLQREPKGPTGWPLPGPERSVPLRPVPPERAHWPGPVPGLTAGQVPGWEQKPMQAWLQWKLPRWTQRGMRREASSRRGPQW
ncbi:MAG: hypothetical protein JWO93_853 [Micrococcaceae bacterium]|nr:hypothetical protein [Micrococcaceae bacterium]